MVNSGNILENTLHSTSDCIIDNSQTNLDSVSPEFTCPNFDREKKVVNIISIDGGGIRGIIPSVIGSYIEENLIEKSMTKHFDVFAGTSTGGIIALGLNVPNPDGSQKHSCSELLDMYNQQGAKLFERSFFYRTVLSGGGLWNAMYPRDGIDAVADGFFKSTRFSESISNILITSFENGPFNFTSHRAHKSEIIVNRHWDHSMSDVAKATSAAPMYFNPFKMKVQENGVEKIRLLKDGGITRNNPAEAAIAYARTLYPNSTDVFVLSIGTGTVRKKVNITNGGAIQWMWGLRIIDCMMDGSSEATHDELKYSFQSIETGGDKSRRQSNYYRFQPDLDEDKYPGISSMDNVKESNRKALEKTAREYINNAEVKAQLDEAIGELNQRYLDAQKRKKNHHHDNK